MRNVAANAAPDYEQLEELPLIDKEADVESLDNFEIPTFLRRRAD
jgi:hypothetical protein